MVAGCVWGSIQWTYLHLLSFNYPENPSQETKQQMLNYILAMGSVLPCDECRVHFFDNLKENLEGYTLESALVSRSKFTRWMYNFHNLVSKQIGKTKWPTFEEVSQIYEPIVSSNSCDPNSCNADSTDIYCKVEFLKKNKTNEKDIIIGILVFIIFVLVAVLFMFYFSKFSVGNKFISGKKTK